MAATTRRLDPLALAIASRGWELAETLIRTGSDPDGVDGAGVPHLAKAAEMFTVATGAGPIFQLLLAAGADPLVASGTRSIVSILQGDVSSRVSAIRLHESWAQAARAHAGSDPVRLRDALALRLADEDFSKTGAAGLGELCSAALAADPDGLGPFVQLADTLLGQTFPVSERTEIFMAESARVKAELEALAIAQASAPAAPPEPSDILGWSPVLADGSPAAAFLTRSFAEALLDDSFDSAVESARAQIVAGLDVVGAFAESENLDDAKRMQGALRDLSATPVLDGAELAFDLEASVAIGGSDGMAYYEAARVPASDIESGLVALAAKTLCRAHWLGESEPPDPDQDAASGLSGDPGRVFCAELPHLGPFAEALSRTLAESRQENAALSRAAWALERCIKHAAEIGLLPESLATNMVRIDLCSEGFGPVEERPLYLVQINEFRSGRMDELIRHGSGATSERRLRLGTLGDGADALWKRFSESVALLRHFGAFRAAPWGPADAALAEEALLLAASQSEPPRPRRGAL